MNRSDRNFEYGIQRDQIGKDALNQRTSIWISNLLRYVGVDQVKEIVIYVDNKSAIELAKNPVDHGRSKHIDVRFHYIREQVKEGRVKLEYVESRAQAADMFIKPLPTVQLENCKKLIGMRDGRSI